MDRTGAHKENDLEGDVVSKWEDCEEVGGVVMFAFAIATRETEATTSTLSGDDHELKERLVLQWNEIGECDRVLKLRFKRDLSSRLIRTKEIRYRL